MKTTTFKSQYRKFRMLTARFFSYWFFIIFATLGVAIAVMERFTNYFGVDHLEPFMILILSYAIFVYIVTERAKVLDDIHDNLRSAKAEVYPTRESVYMAVPLIIARASADAQGRRRIFHAALHGLGGKRLARPSRPDPVFEVFDGAIDRCVASTGPGMWRVYEIYNIPDEERLDVLAELIGKRQGAEGYEVRAFARAEGLPHLSPLVIGDEDLLIGGRRSPLLPGEFGGPPAGPGSRPVGDRVFLLPLERPAHPDPQDGDGGRPGRDRKIPRGVPRIRTRGEFTARGLKARMGRSSAGKGTSWTGPSPDPGRRHPVPRGGGRVAFTPARRP